MIIFCEYCRVIYISNLDYTFAKNKWENLRDGYNAARKRYAAATRSGAAAGKPPSWPNWNQMLWLDEFLKRVELVLQKAAHLLTVITN